MTVALGHCADDATPAALAALKVPVAAGLTVITVKPNALASSPELATTTPTHVRMTFITQPFRRGRAHEPGARVARAQPPIMAA
jgi:hypothetical protein